MIIQIQHTQNCRKYRVPQSKFSIDLDQDELIGLHGDAVLDVLHVEKTYAWLCFATLHLRVSRVNNLIGIELISLEYYV